MPRMSSLNHPASCLPTWMQGQARITTTAWCAMSLIAFQHHHAMRWDVVIGRIQTQMLWLCRAWTWPDNRTVIEQFVQHRRIVNIGGRHKDAHWNSSAIHQNMVLDAWFGAIRRVRPSLFSPPPATSHRCRRQIAIPSQCHVSHRRGANTWHEFAHILRRASTLQSGHRRSARDRTLWARHATDNPPRAHRGWHQGSSDHRGPRASAKLTRRSGREQFLNLLPQVIRNLFWCFHIDSLPNLLGLQTRTKLCGK